MDRENYSADEVAKMINITLYNIYRELDTRTIIRMYPLTARGERVIWALQNARKRGHGKPVMVGSTEEADCYIVDVMTAKLWQEVDRISGQTPVFYLVHIGDDAKDFAWVDHAREHTKTLQKRADSWEAHNKTKPTELRGSWDLQFQRPGRVEMQEPGHIERLKPGEHVKHLEPGEVLPGVSEVLPGAGVVTYQEFTAYHLSNEGIVKDASGEGIVKPHTPRQHAVRGFLSNGTKRLVYRIWDILTLPVSDLFKAGKK